METVIYSTFITLGIFMNRILLLITLFLSCLSLPATASDFELTSEKVADDVYALIGEIGPRTKENEALNNTMGFVITDEGVVLVGSGATESGAKLIEKAIAKVTDKPIKQLINIGAQDHHWMGNSYFASKKIPIMALAGTVRSQKNHTDDHLARLKKVLGQAINKEKVAYADTVIKGKDHRFEVGGKTFELKFLGASHFSDDAVLWLPQEKVIFAGDMVFNDRMLGIHPFTDVKAWNDTFKKMASMKPKFVIPGHGHAGGLEKAQKDTGDYLNWLVTEVSKSVEDWEGLADVTERLEENNPFTYLKFYEGWNGKNISRTYLQFENK